MSDDTKWVVTGGCGFIGANLVNRLGEERGQTVRVVDDLSTGRQDYLEIDSGADPDGGEEIAPVGDLPAGSVQLVTADILDRNVARNAVQGADAVVHLAAATGVPQSVEDPFGDCRTNVVGTLTYLDAAADASADRFVFASSGAPLGACDPPVHEEMAPRPAAPYGASKLAGEGYCSAYYHSFDIETAALRFGNVYGPYSAHKESVVARFVRRGLSGRELEIFGDGEQTRDYIYSGDLVEAIVRAARVSDVGGEIFQVATNVETSVNELAAVVNEQLTEIGLKPAEAEHAPPRKGDVRRNYSDISKADEVLDWRPETRLAEGVRETIEWFRSQEGM